MARGWWGAGLAMPTARDGAGSALGGDKISVRGGVGDGGYLSTVEVLDLSRGSWEAGPAMPTARSGAGAVFAGGDIHVIGGEGGGGGGRGSTVEVRDLSIELDPQSAV